MEKLKIFISMPFTGKKYEDLYNERLYLKGLVESYWFELTEQFIGYQFKEDFDSKDYNPTWVLWKDKNWLKQSDVVISDFTSYSMWTDFELVLCKEVFDKKVYAVVPNEKRFHPWLRFYCDNFYDSVEQALIQIKIDFPNWPIIKPVDKRQYDAIAWEYRLIEETISQKYIYDEILNKQLEKYNAIWKKVVVLHCWSGYRTRFVKRMWAKQVLWINLSYNEIRIAENIESEENLWINYLVSDYYTQDFIENINSDLVWNVDCIIWYFALDHAMNKRELDIFFNNVYKLLNKNWVFIWMTDKYISHNESFSKYWVLLSFDNKNKYIEEWKPRRVSILQNNKEIIHFHNFYWKEDTIKESLINSDFKDISIKDAYISDKWINDLWFKFFKDYIDNPDQIVIEARK
jgi:hypothetical protein